MEWLLKVVEGQMKGAEVALLPGFRVKVGSSDVCDIVLADSSLAEQAFELDVTEETVTLIPPDGEPKALPALAVFRFGSSAFAYGPSVGAWGELKELSDEGNGATAGNREAAGGETPRSLPGEGGFSDVPAAALDGDSPLGKPVTVSGSIPEAPAARRNSRRRLVICCCALAVLALLAALAWPWIGSTASAAWQRTHDFFVPPPPPPPPPPPTLAEIAKAHGLTVGTRNGRPLIAGNVRLRTERLAIRALALATDPMTDFDLTDDESLRASSTDLLFVVTEGDLYATAASNRVVTIAGYAPDQAHLETSIRALNQDVPGILRLVTKDVRIGGSRPKRVGMFRFQKDGSGVSAFASASARAGGSAAQGASGKFQESDGGPRSPAGSSSQAAWGKSPEGAGRSRTPGGSDSPDSSDSSRKLSGKAGSLTPLPPARSYAIAGILTKPYPCLVMRNGTRLTEGAQVEGCVVEKIEVDRLILKEGSNRFEWRP